MIRIITVVVKLDPNKEKLQLSLCVHSVVVVLSDN